MFLYFLRKKFYYAGSIYVLHYRKCAIRNATFKGSSNKRILDITIRALRGDSSEEDMVRQYFKIIDENGYIADYDEGTASTQVRTLRFLTSFL